MTILSDMPQHLIVHRMVSIARRCRCRARCSGDRMATCRVFSPRVCIVAINLGFRSTGVMCLINDPAGIRQVLVTEEPNFPKSDLMIAPLKPLLGDGILISNGPVWQGQRAMLEPAFQQMRLRHQFPVMARPSRISCRGWKRSDR
jgi:cytochrome P450